MFGIFYTLEDKLSDCAVIVIKANITKACLILGIHYEYTICNMIRRKYFKNNNLEYIKVNREKEKWLYNILQKSIGIHISARNKVQYPFSDHNLVLLMVHLLEILPYSI